MELHIIDSTHFMRGHSFDRTDIGITLACHGDLDLDGLGTLCRIIETEPWEYLKMRLGFETNHPGPWNDIDPDTHPGLGYLRTLTRRTRDLYLDLT